MPKLLNRPPKYLLRKSTKQAVVSIHGKVIQLGPFGSPRSHQRYQEQLINWRECRHEKSAKEEPAEPEVTLIELQARRMRAYAISIDELAFVYLDFARSYYVKNGRVTREAEVVGDVLRVLARHHSGEAADEFGPVKLKELRERMIHEMNWARKNIRQAGDAFCHKSARPDWLSKRPSSLQVVSRDGRLQKLGIANQSIPLLVSRQD